MECLVSLFDTLVARASSQFAGAGFDRTVFRDTLHSAFGMTDDVVLDRGEGPALGAVPGLGWRLPTRPACQCPTASSRPGRDSEGGVMLGGC